MTAFDVVATDLDGTLWDETERIHPDALAAVAELEAAGVPVLVATGRRQRTARQVLQDHGLSLPGVFLDGSVVLDADQTLMERASFPADGAVRVLETFSAAGVTPLLIVDRPGVDLVRSADYVGNLAHLERNRRWLDFGAVERIVEREPVLAFVVIGGDAERLRPVEAAVAGLAAASLTRDRTYGGTTLQVRPAGISKWSGVLTYCVHRGADPRRVLAVGDAANDVELLTGAAVACAMADAAPEVLALADHVLPTAGSGGWAGIARIALD